MRLLAIICAVAIALGGCGATEQTAPTAGQPATQGVPAASPAAGAPDATVPATTEVPPMSTPAAGSPAATVVAMHAQAFNVDPAAIRVVSADEVEWPSSALGCPKPDMMYLTVITPGFKVVVEQGGTQYSYHAGSDGAFFLCESPEN
ncbi:MAG TPA: hypothetical protein VD886_11395 [Herpetosiphonaceae bacterium]|nr:hypothetical protein [Herpetosiphonaceae bacterium]